MASRHGKSGRVRQTRIETAIDEERGVFMISVAAELADMHPQTLRMYEARGLITPKRSPKNTRLYSQKDVERLRRIQQMTTEEGLNLAGVETVLEMEARVAKMQAELKRMRDRGNALQRQLAEEVERVRRSLKAEIVPYKAYDVIPDRPAPVKIPVERNRRSRRGGEPSASAE